MGSSPQAANVTLGALKPNSMWGQYSNTLFLVQQALAKMQTATLVQIEACTNDGDLSPVGTVDVRPLVNQIDGSNPPNPTPHTTIFGLPYLRIQGGNNGIIIDPQPGDIGVAVFASRDISKVKATKAQANPGSFRSYDFQDGMYLGGMLNGTPQQYIQFSASGITILSPNNVTLTAPGVQMGASGGALQTLMTNAFLEYFTNVVLPFLESKGFTGGPPPASSVTTATEAS